MAFHVLNLLLWLTTKPKPDRRMHGGVNVNEDYEVRSWCAKFGCTPEQLKAVVKKVGVMAKDVEAELKLTGRKHAGG
jgi:hypothetical protein